MSLNAAIAQCLFSGIGVVLLGAFAAPAQALCVDGRVPTRAQEVAASSGVLLARVLHATPLHEDAGDPDGISAVRYRVERMRTLRGTPPEAFDLYSDNTSARFPMEASGRYLLYLRRDRAGRYYVDACGHSRRLPAKETPSAEKS